MASLVSGSIDRAGYTAYLGQLLHVHATLEPALRAGARRHPALAVVVRDHHFREHALRADLAALGEHLDAHPPLPATRLFCGRIDGLAAEAPLALLGGLYVLEGSTNGGRFIAPAVRHALGLPTGAKAGPGTTYLEPHGESQRDRWSFFKSCIDVLALTPAEHELIVAAATDAFRGMHDIFEDLTHPAPAPAACPPPGRSLGAANGSVPRPAEAHVTIPRRAEKEGRAPHST